MANIRDPPLVPVVLVRGRADNEDMTQRKQWSFISFVWSIARNAINFADEVCLWVTTAKTHPAMVHLLQQVLR